MKALLRQTGITCLVNVSRPSIIHSGDVLLQVAVAGVCRTDLEVAVGHIAVEEPRILGHEFAGIVAEIGDRVRHLQVDDRVAVMPFLNCGRCEMCRIDEPGVCQRAEMLGVHRDGAFAEYVVVPASVVYRVPDSVPFCEAAYAEPITAALAVLRAGLQPSQRGVVYGKNRFSRLVEKLLRLHDFTDVRIVDATDDSPPTSSFDFAIETIASAEAFAEMIRTVKPRGTIVVKSRNPRLVAVPLGLAVAKEIAFRAVHYGSFSQSLALLAERRLELAELLGPVYPLEAFLTHLAGTRQREDVKMFLTPGTIPCVD